MRINFKKYKSIISTLSLILVFCLISINSRAQKKEKVYMKMNYKQVVDEYRFIEVSLRTRIEGKFHPITDAPVDILMKTESNDQLLATIHTNSEGYAQLAIDKEYPLFKDEEGKYTLLAKFKGNNTFKKANKKVKARDLQIQANFIDTDYSIEISALEFIKDSLTMPTEELDFDVFVDRMFADLKVASGTLTEGTAKITIPDDIPGDINGNIKLFILIDEKDYQLVEYSKDINWGVPLVKEIDKNKNAATISYVAFMILSTIVIAIFGLLLSRRINNKS